MPDSRTARAEQVAEQIVQGMEKFGDAPVEVKEYLLTKILDALTAEAERVAQAQQEAETRLRQTDSDLERERGRKGDAEAATTDLDGQRGRLELPPPQFERKTEWPLPRYSC